MTRHTPELVAVLILIVLLAAGLAAASIGLPPRAERVDHEGEPDA